MMSTRINEQYARPQEIQAVREVHQPNTEKMLTIQSRSIRFPFLITATALIENSMSALQTIHHPTAAVVKRI